jgi:septum formation protein
MNMLLNQKLEGRKIVLASQSPRRRELIAGLDIPFEIRLIPDIEEDFSPEMPGPEIPLFLAEKKAQAYKKDLLDNEIVITADTVVLLDKHVLNKPADRDEAVKMLAHLSGNCHEVVTGVCLTSNLKQYSFSDSSKVWFKELTTEEIAYYVDKYRPYDKAGAYGIQEWIGYVAIEKIEGSFYNVMGLPVQALYIALDEFLN